MFKTLPPEAMEAVSALFGEISKLPKEEFDQAIQAAAALALGTIHKTQGEKFYNGFLQGAMAYPAPFCVARAPTAH